MAGRTLTRRITAEGIYGCLAIAVVCLAWEEDNLGALAAEILVYAVALWLFHIYARVVYAGWRDRTLADMVRWARHEWPHLEAALPALAIVLAGWAAGWDPVGTSDLALALTLLNLLAWQVALLRPGRPSTAALIGTLAVDLTALAALIALRLWIK